MSRLVVVESPLAGDIARNQRYTRWAILDCFRRGEYPFASHLLYTQCLDDRITAERTLGIEAGIEWGRGKDRVFYVDLCELVDAPPHCAMPDGLVYELTLGMQRAYDQFGGEFRRLQPRALDLFNQGKEPKGT